VRCDSAGATHAFAQACRAAGVGFSFGYAGTSGPRRRETLKRGPLLVSGDRIRLATCATAPEVAEAPTSST